MATSVPEVMHGIECDQDDPNVRGKLYLLHLKKLEAKVTYR